MINNHTLQRFSGKLSETEWTETDWYEDYKLAYEKNIGQFGLTVFDDCSWSVICFPFDRLIPAINGKEDSIFEAKVEAENALMNNMLHSAVKYLITNNQ